MARVLTEAANETTIFSGVRAGLICSISVRHLEGLYADQNQIGLARGIQVAGAHVHAPLRAERQGALVVRHGGVNLPGRKQVLLEEGLQQNAAHFARAQHGQANLGQLRRYLVGLYGYLRHVFSSWMSIGEC